MLCLLATSPNRAHMHDQPTWIRLSNLSQKYAEALRSRATSAEREMCRLLDAAKISYVFQSNMYDGKTGTIFIADFRIRRQHVGRPKGVPRKEWRKQHRLEKLFVEIDGGYHVQRREYDEKRTRWMESHRNAIVLRFTNNDVFARGADIIAEIEQYGPVHRTVYVSKTSPFKVRKRKPIW